MADKKETDERVPDGPTLIAPRREQVVDGTDVRFEWEPVDDVDEYVLQVAEETSFDDVVYEQNMGRQTSASVTDVFEADERTYYWRVLAHTEAGWSPGENVESFLSGTAEDAETHATSPEEDERYGPAGALHEAAAVEVAADVTGQEALFEREKEMGVAHEGIEAKQILAIVLVVILAIIGLVVTLITAVDNTSRQQQRAVVGASGYPERVEVENEALQQLNRYEVLDDEEGVYRIPIERAKELTVRDAQQQPAPESSSELSVSGEN